jgi:2-polyprenyl-6-hydroxyphenyl methylase/3-demethylubiquinone-9 3-methyltransferase
MHSPILGEAAFAHRVVPRSPVALLGFAPLSLEDFDRFVPEWHGKRALALGADAGAELLARRGTETSALARSAEALQAGEARTRGSGLPIRWHQGVPEKLPFRDHSFELVLCLDVLERVDDVTTSLREVRRVLRPGGRILVRTLNRTVKSKVIRSWILRRLLRSVPAGEEEWERYLTPGELAAALRSAGFADVSLAGVDPRRRGTGDNGDLSFRYIGAAVRPR